MSHQTGEHPESRSLVNHPIKAVVGEGMPVPRFVVNVLHWLAGNRIEARRPRAAGQCQMECPSPTARMTVRLLRPGRSGLRRYTTPRPQTFGAEEIGTRQIH